MSMYRFAAMVIKKQSLLPICEHAVEMGSMMKRAVLLVALTSTCLAMSLASARADRIKHPTAVFSGLDKITGRIINFEVAIDETVQFGSLQITPRVCYTRPPTEMPQTTAFVEVDDVGAGNDYKRIFSGWMFAASPGLHGIEHPVYDAWLTNCKGGTTIIRTQPDTLDANAPPAQPGPANRPPNVTGPAPQQGGQNGAKPRAVSPSGAAPDLGSPVEVGKPPTTRATPNNSNLPPVDIPDGPRRAPSQQFFPTNH
jgi:hypothetical protein